jgi:hypothetical protein
MGFFRLFIYFLSVGHGKSVNSTAYEIIHYFCVMLVPINQMPSDSRIWIYQADRKLSEKEETKIAIKSKIFLENWTSHNEQLKSSFDIRYGIFLILMIDEKHTSAGGCSIDKSVHFIKQLEKEYAVNLLDRNIFAFKKDEEVSLVKRTEFEKLLENGTINENTVVFNNLVQSLELLANAWEIPLRDSWHKQIT